MKNSKLLWIISGFLILLNLVEYIARWGGENILTIFSDSLPALSALISSICLLKAFRAFHKTNFARAAWLLIFIGITLDFVAESLYGFLEVVLKMDMNQTFPSVADYIWCTGYIPMFIGLVMMLTGYKNSGFPFGDRRFYIGLVIALAITITVITYALFIPIVSDSETNLLATIFYLYYPIADIVMVIPALILIYITSLFGSGKISRPWKYLAIGLILFTLADLIYSYLSWQDLYGSGNFIDLAWHAGYLLIGLSGLYQQELIKSFGKGGAQ